MWRSIIVLLATLFFAAAGAAQTADGTWVGAIEADDFFGAVRLDITSAKDSKITLFYAGDRRGGSIENFKISGSELTFDAKMQPAAKFRGTVSDTSIKGTFDIFNRSGAVQGTGVWDVRRTDPSSIVESSPPSSAGDDRAELPPPNGKFRIGRRFLYFTDESRIETITDDPNDKRRLFVQLWYPAAKAEKNADAEYLPHLEEFRAAAAANLSALRRIKTHAKTDAPVAKDKKLFPLIIFSPGLGSSSFTNTALFEHFVSNGYAVAAIAHPYDTEGYKFSDGTVISYDSKKWDREAPKDWTAEERRKFMDERRLGWAADVSFVLDRLKEHALARHFDFNALGVAGYSFGGQAASIACASDARFKACANLDGLAQGNAVLPDAGGRRMKQPFLFFTKAPEVTDWELKLIGLTREQYRTRESRRLLTKWKPSFKQQMAAVESGSYLIVYPNVKHSSFGDYPLTDTKSGQTYAERAAVVRNVYEYTRAFFDKYLKKVPSTLLDKPEKQRGLIVEYLKK